MKSGAGGSGGGGEAKIWEEEAEWEGKKRKGKAFTRAQKKQVLGKFKNRDIFLVVVKSCG